ncbi:hypothetical protein [Pararhizobium sp. DWP3-4]|uniref:hypothetical protein n=1 Tax=Pararhizobium sp. DWP3-4 TaxID=2804565 RepID=UPI003CE883D7
MFSIDMMHDSAMEAFFKALNEGKKERWMAAVAWWVHRQFVTNCPDYWGAMAAHVTVALPSSDREAISSQLTKNEDILVANAGEMPPMPREVIEYMARWEPIPAPFDIEAAKADAIKKIDRDAEAYRLNFITNGSGQVMAYQQKLSEAKAKLADDGIADASIPHIVAEAAVDGVTLAAKAEQIVATFEGWQIVSAGIERKRMAAKKAVTAAETAEAITAAAAVNWGAS